MTRHLRSQLGNARHRQNGDDGNLSFNPFGIAVATLPTCFLPTQKHAPTQNIATCDGHRDEHLPNRDRISTQAVLTTPIAYQHNPAVSYLEAF